MLNSSQNPFHSLKGYFWVTITWDVRSIEICSGNQLAHWGLEQTYFRTCDFVHDEPRRKRGSKKQLISPFLLNAREDELSVFFMQETKILLYMKACGFFGTSRSRMFLDFPALMSDCSDMHACSLAGSPIFLVPTAMLTRKIWHRLDFLDSC